MAILELSPVARALERVRESRRLEPRDAEALLDTPSSEVSALLDAASEVRDRGRGRRITFSAKVFVPLTTLCRDYCGYCTFRKDPGEPGAFTLTPEQVLSLVKAGERLGAKEALFSLGDKPEALFPEHRAFLRRHGHRTTLGYLRAMCALTLDATPLLPHVNPGLMPERAWGPRRRSSRSETSRRRSSPSIARSSVRSVTGPRSATSERCVGG